MLWLPALAGLVGFQAATAQIDQSPRFVSRAPLTSISGVKVDRLNTGLGLANEMARKHRLQGRMLWIDCTANLDRYDSDEKLSALTAQIAKAGFNTIVLDVKPISGQVIYRTDLAPQLDVWKGKTRDTTYDALAGMLRHAKPKGLSVLISLNAFSEGHRLFKVGPGYAKPEWQTTVYDFTRQIVSETGATFEVAATLDKAEGSKLRVYTASDRVPTVTGAFAITLRPDGTVVDGFENGGLGPTVPTIPKGGVVLYGEGEAAAFLRSAATPGRKLRFDTRPQFVKMADWSGSQYPLMVNPNHPEVRAHELGMLKELVTRYPVDGVLYDDRLRYVGINGDFSDESRAAFEKFIGKPVANWPEDALKITLNQDLTSGVQPGPLYDQWMAFRAHVITKFVADARATVKAARPTAAFGAYVGSWYGEYSSLGHNYADPEVAAPFWFASPNYQATGSAQNFDLLVPGCYYPTATIYQAMSQGAEIGRTVEASATLVNGLVHDQAWTYAGLALSQFKDNPTGLANALQAASASAQGIMVFDLSHDIDPMWSVFEKAFTGAPKQAPHERLDLLKKVRGARKAADGKIKKGTIPVSAGAAGTGQ